MLLRKWTGEKVHHVNLCQVHDEELSQVTYMSSSVSGDVVEVDEAELTPAQREEVQGDSTIIHKGNTYIRVGYRW